MFWWTGVNIGPAPQCTDWSHCLQVVFLLSQADRGFRNVSPVLDDQFLVLCVSDATSLGPVMEASQGRGRAAACATVCRPMGRPCAPWGSAVGFPGLASAKGCCSAASSMCGHSSCCNVMLACIMCDCFVNISSTSHCLMELEIGHVIFAYVNSIPVSFPPLPVSTTFMGKKVERYFSMKPARGNLDGWVGVMPWQINSTWTISTAKNHIVWLFTSLSIPFHGSFHWCQHCVGSSDQCWNHLLTRGEEGEAWPSLWDSLSGSLLIGNAPLSPRSRGGSAITQNVSAPRLASRRVL